MGSKYWIRDHNGRRVRRSPFYWFEFDACEVCKADAGAPCRNMTTEKAGKFPGFDLKEAHAGRPRPRKQGRPEPKPEEGYQGRHRA